MWDPAEIQKKKKFEEEAKKSAVWRSNSFKNTSSCIEIKYKHSL